MQYFSYGVPHGYVPSKAEAPKNTPSDKPYVATTRQNKRWEFVKYRLLGNDTDRRNRVEPVDPDFPLPKVPDATTNQVPPL